MVTEELLPMVTVVSTLFALLDVEDGSVGHSNG